VRNRRSRWKGKVNFPMAETLYVHLLPHGMYMLITADVHVASIVRLKECAIWGVEWDGFATRGNQQSVQTCIRVNRALRKGDVTCGDVNLV
jgi:hypothetical protein